MAAAQIATPEITHNVRTHAFGAAHARSPGPPRSCSPPLSEAGDKAEHAALADAAPHQFEIDDLVIVDVEIDGIAECVEIPDLGAAVLRLKNEVLHIEM